MTWYYLQNQEQRGPVEDTEVDALIRQDVIRRETLVWQDGMSDWCPAAQTSLLIRIKRNASAAPAPAADHTTDAAPENDPPSAAKALDTLQTVADLQAASARPPRTSRGIIWFFKSLPGALVFPLKKDSLLLLFIGTVYFWVMRIIQGFSFSLIILGLGTGYLAAYLFKIIVATSNGEEDMPDWPSVANGRRDVIDPLIQVLAALFMAFLPLIVVGVIWWQFDWFHPAVAFGMLVLGLFYTPMALLSMALHDTAEGVSPLLVLPAIFRTLPAYIPTFSILVLAVGIRMGSTLFLALIPNTWLASFCDVFIGFYFLIVEARVLGLLYLACEDRFHWFDHV
jgi:hypothetical protein